MRYRQQKKPLPAWFLTLSAALFACQGSLHADWVSLRNGDHLRGINLEKTRDGYRFTLENGKVTQIAANEFFHLEKSAAGERVTFRGKKITLKKKISVLQKEMALQLVSQVRNVETWARGEHAATRLKLKPQAITGKQAAKEKERVIVGSFPRPALKKKEADLVALVGNGLKAMKKHLELDRDKQVRTLAKTLSGSRLAAARRLAARELGKHSSSTGLASLARSAMVDDYRSIRDLSLASLRKINDKNTAMYFVPGLRNENPHVRTRAANAISVFPNRAAVPELLTTMRMTWSGFGRAFMMQVTQRSYIADYELVSGGTGFSLVEVADPVVKTNLEGVALDVKVRRVEMVARIRALHKITGQDFGTNVRAWENWWEKNKNN